MKTLGCFN